MSSPEGSSVTFRRVPATLRRRAIERFARRLQKEVAGGSPFDTLIAGDAELRRLNRDFRKKDYTTDVLSFPSPGSRLTGLQGRFGQAAAPEAQCRPAKGSAGPGLGDVAISLGRARAQAREFGHSIEQEISVLMLHGVLHLLGHDHEVDRGRMARLEKRWRAKLGLPTGLIERVQS